MRKGRALYRQLDLEEFGKANALRHLVELEFPLIAFGVTLRSTCMRRKEKYKERQAVEDNCQAAKTTDSRRRKESHSF